MKSISHLIYKKEIFLLAIFLISFVSSATMTNVTIKTSSGDEIFINNSMRADKISIQDGTVSVINLSSGAYFLNTNSLLDSIITFTGLVNPNNDFERDGSIIARDIAFDFSPDIYALGYLVVGDYDVSSGGGISAFSVAQVEKPVYIEVVKEKIAWGLVIALIGGFVVFVVYNKKITNTAKLFYLRYKKEKKKNK